MVDVSDSKSDGGDTVWVQVPPQAPFSKYSNYYGSFFLAFFPFCGIITTHIENGDLNMELLGLIYGVSFVGLLLGMVKLINDINERLKKDNI